MKRILLPLFLAATATLAAEPKFGLVVQGILPVVDAPSPLESTLGFGALCAVEARFDLDEKFTIAPFGGFEFTHHGVELERNSRSAEVSMNSFFLPLGVSFQFAVTPALRLAATPEIDVSLGGTAKAEYSSGGSSYSPDQEEIEGDESPLMLGLGIVYGETDKSALLLGYKIATGDYVENYKLHKFYLGGRFAM